MAFNMRNNMAPRDNDQPQREAMKQQKREAQTQQFFGQDSVRKDLSERAQRIAENVHEGEEQEFDYDIVESEYMNDNPDDVLLRWQGPEYEVYEKSRAWYTVAALALAAIALYAILTNSPVMAIVFVLIGLVGYLYFTTPPRVQDYGITYDGIIVGKELYHFDDMEAFWIFYNPPHTRVISIHMKGRFVPYVHIPLHQLDPVQVRELLLEFVDEERQEHNLIDTVERLFHI